MSQHEEFGEEIVEIAPLVLVSSLNVALVII
jgi:hypothetical protein